MGGNGKAEELRLENSAGVVDAPPLDHRPAPLGAELLVDTERFDKLPGEWRNCRN